MWLINFISKKNNANETGSSFCNTQSIILQNFNRFSYSHEAKYMFLKLCHFFIANVRRKSVRFCEKVCSPSIFFIHNKSIEHKHTDYRLLANSLELLRVPYIQEIYNKKVNLTLRNIKKFFLLKTAIKVKSIIVNVQDIDS